MLQSFKVAGVLSAHHASLAGFACQITGIDNSMFRTMRQSVLN